MNFQKRRKSYYASQKSKRRREFILKPGLKGFICTCNNREKECVRESYNILNEYADILYGEEMKNKESQGTSKNEEKDSEEDDIESALNKELDTLKAEKKMEANMRRFQIVESGANNCIFIQTNVDEPVQLVHHIMKEVRDSKKQRARFLMRLLPIEVTCKAYLEDIRIAADGLFDKYFAEEGKTFAILFNRRNSSSIGREEVIHDLAEMVMRRHPDNKADLKHPQLVVLVEIIRNNCCMSVIPEYFELRKYNLLELSSVASNCETTKEEFIQNNSKVDQGKCSTEEDKESPSIETTKKEFIQNDPKADQVNCSVVKDKESTSCETTKEECVQNDSKVDQDKCSVVEDKESTITENKESGVNNI